jgi:hypothetical protein
MPKQESDRLRDYYTRSVTISRAAKLSLALFTIFFIIACGSKDGMHAMMKLFGSLFGAPEVGNPEQFFIWAPLAYFGYSIVVCGLLARRLMLRDDWKKQFDQIAPAEDIDWRADVCGIAGSRAVPHGFYVRLAANTALMLFVIIAFVFNFYNMLIYNPGGRVGSPTAVTGMKTSFIPQVLGCLTYVIVSIILLRWDQRSGRSCDSGATSTSAARKQNSSERR